MYLISGTDSHGTGRIIRCGTPNAAVDSNRGGVGGGGVCRCYPLAVISLCTASFRYSCSWAPCLDPTSGWCCRVEKSLVGFVVRCATACGRVGRSRKWLGELDIAFNQRGGGGGGRMRELERALWLTTAFCLPARHFARPSRVSGPRVKTLARPRRQKSQ